MDLVHGHGLYDVEVDTSKGSPRECALAIVAALRGIGPAGAFQRLREEMSPGE
jgi:hypothetical protein